MQRVTIEQAQNLSKTSTEVIMWRPESQDVHQKFEDIPVELHYAVTGVRDTQ